MSNPRLTNIDRYGVCTFDDGSTLMLPGWAVVEKIWEEPDLGAMWKIRVPGTDIISGYTFSSMASLCCRDMVQDYVHHLEYDRQYRHQPSQPLGLG